MITKPRWAEDVEVLSGWLEEEIDKCDGNSSYKPPPSLILNCLQTILYLLSKRKGDRMV